MSQEDVANITGIARIESGKNVPTIEVLAKLAMALDMEVEIKFVDINSTKERKENHEQ